MERIRRVEHKGKQIIIIDFSEAKPEESLHVIENAKKIISSMPENPVLTLTNVTNIEYNPEITRALKEYTAFNKPYVKAAAVMGVAGLKYMLLQAIMKFSRRNIRPFSDEEKAKDWLVQQ